MRKEDIKKGIYILPNLFTTANLFCGYFAVIRAINGDTITASWIIILAGLFDFLDGRMARLTNSQSEFGLEYDSLVDLSTFGLATSILMYKWTLQYFGRLGWAAAFLFFACAALRLARFNIQAGSVEKKAFQGLPVPAGAGFLVSYVIFSHHFWGINTSVSYFTLVMTFFLGLLMVSNVPYRNFKVLDRRKRVNFFILVIVVGIVFVLASAPQVMFFIFGIGYVSMGLIEELLKSPKKIRSFADFMVRFFHAHPRDLLLEEEEKDEGSSLKVVGMKGEESFFDKKE